MAKRKWPKTRKMTHEDLRKMIIAGQGWDPGDLSDLSRIKPLSKKELEHPFFKMLPRSRFIDGKWVDEK